MVYLLYSQVVSGISLFYSQVGNIPWLNHPFSHHIKLHRNCQASFKHNLSAQTHPLRCSLGAALFIYFQNSSSNVLVPASQIGHLMARAQPHASSHNTKPQVISWVLCIGRNIIRKKNGNYAPQWRVSFTWDRIKIQKKKQVVWSYNSYVLTDILQE